MNNPGQTKLTPDEFRTALRQGRGTALMHVLSHGLEHIASFVLDACLEEQAFDLQCEDLRAGWLYRMFKGAPEHGVFRRRIIAELYDMAESSSAEQLCELAALMARDGDHEAAQALRSFVWAQDFESDGSMVSARGCHAIVSVDGLPALLDIARRYGRILQEDQDVFVDSLEALVDGAEAYERALAELNLRAKDDPAISAYVERERRERDTALAIDRESPEETSARRELYRAETLEKFPLEAVFAAAMRHETARFKFHQFGRWCSEGDLAAVLERLAVESDRETCLRLLWIFRNAAPPFIPERLWVLAMHDDVRIRDAALTALAHSDDPAVGAFGRKYLAQRTFSADDAAAIELFARHYQPGDETLIMDALGRLRPDEAEAHDVGMSIRRFAEDNHGPSIAPILHWLYETNPCTLCRAGAVRLLVDAGCLSSAVAQECQFDASGEIQDLVKT